MNYPNALGENFREERERLLVTSSGDSQARQVHACLMHDEEVRTLRKLFTCLLKEEVIISLTPREMEVIEQLNVELTQYKLKARRLENDSED